MISRQTFVLCNDNNGRRHTADSNGAGLSIHFLSLLPHKQYRLGAGVTGYGGSYSAVPDLGKWLLAPIMMIGRSELFTALILFYTYLLEEASL